jgi:shikimate kinase
VNVILIGLKHCGKSTLGRRLAKELGVAFVDTDALVCRLREQRTGENVSIREVFRAVGEQGFAELERQAVGELTWQLEEERREAVIALGGRTAMQKELHPALKQLGTVVYLQVDVEVLLARVLAGGVPPFLDPDNPQESFRAICRDRNQVYESLADVIVDLDGLDIPEATAAVRLAVADIC